MSNISLRLVTLLSLTIGVALCPACVPIVRAQEVPASQEDATKQLLERVRELEAKLKQLEEKQSAAPAPASAPEPAPVVEQPQVNEVAPRLKLLFFGDAGYQIGHFYGPTSTFEFGEFDMFASARLTDKLSALTEILFTSSS